MFKVGDKVRLIKGYGAAREGDEGIIRALPRKNGAGQTLWSKQCLNLDIVFR